MKNLIILALLLACGYMGWSLYGAQIQALIAQKTATTTVPAAVKPTAPAPASPSTPSTAAPLSARVSVTSPVKHEVVGRSFTVTGSAPGGWYFEASFPIQVRDSEGNVVARSHGQASGQWMTDADVPFTAEVHIDTDYRGAADLILMRDNPSGLPENDDSSIVPIQLK